MKKQKRSRPLVCAAVFLFVLLVSVALWFGATWLVGTTVNKPAPEKSSKAPKEKILPEERKQLEGLIKRRS